MAWNRDSKEHPQRPQLLSHCTYQHSTNVQQLGRHISQLIYSRSSIATMLLHRLGLQHLQSLGVKNNFQHCHSAVTTANRECLAQDSRELSTAACLNCCRQLLQGCTLTPQLLLYSCCKCLARTYTSQSHTCWFATGRVVDVANCTAVLCS